MTSPLLTGRAVARSGDSGRMNAFLAKLKRREPVTIVAVGGSISTREYAGCTSGVAEAWVGVELGPGCAPGRGWGRMALEWLNATWPPLYGEHRLIAFGRTGIAADGFVDCLTTHIANLSSTNGRTRDGPVDLFFLEFAITGASSKGDTAAPLEALVRRLLSLPGQPAILPVNFFPFLANKEASWEMGPLPSSSPRIPRWYMIRYTTFLLPIQRRCCRHPRSNGVVKHLLSALTPSDCDRSAPAAGADYLHLFVLLPPSHLCSRRVGSSNAYR